MRAKLALSVILCALFFCQSIKANTYYVSPSGDDLNSGTSENDPWATLAKVDSTVFSPGDIILFEGGATFTGTLYFDVNDMGTPANPIVLNSYGTGRATINSDIEVGIYVYNAAGYKITNLNIVGSGTATNESSGILFYMDSATITPRLKYVFIDAVEVSGYRNDGISVGSNNSSNGYDDVTITNCSVHNIGFVGIGSYALLRIGHKNLYVAYDTVYNVNGNGDTTRHSGSGILVGGFDGAIVEYCKAHHNGSLNKAISGGPVGIWVFQSNDVTLQYNESHHNETIGRDGGGFDFDGGVTNSLMQYNDSHDNAGAGYLLCQNRTIYPWTNNVIRYNTSENDGLKNNYAGIHLYSNKYAGGINNLDIYENQITNPFIRGVYIQSDGIYNTNIHNNDIIVTAGKYNIYTLTTAINSSLKFQKNNYGDPATFKVSWLGKIYSDQKTWRDSTFQENFIYREIWSNVAGTTVKTIPVKTTPSLLLYLDNYEPDQNYADNYGERISGYITAPQTGDYTFWISGDDACTLYLSTNAKPKNKVKIATVAKRTNFRDFTKTIKQKSLPVSLTAGNKYYIEILHKESVDADHVSVQWQLPDGTIQVPVPGVNTPSAKQTISAAITTHALQPVKNSELKIIAYPNPFNSLSTIQFVSNTNGKASLQLFDVKGKLLQNLFTGNIQKGIVNKVSVTHEALVSGIYFVKLMVGNKTTALKLLLSK